MYKIRETNFFMKLSKQKKKNRKHRKGIQKKEKSPFLKKMSDGTFPAFKSSENTKFSITSTVRLSKAARILNKGISEIVSHFEENGFNIESSPNYKFSKEEIEFLNESDKEKHIVDTHVIDYTWKLLEDLKLDYNLIFKITPEQFEKLVAELFKRNGFEVRMNGKTNSKDGGIDVIAWKKDIVNIVIAVQVKFKSRIEKKVEAGEVRDLKGALAINDYFTAGMLVTNTAFTSDARWIEEQVNSKLELKNAKDIKQWLSNNFATSKKIDLNCQFGKDIHFNQTI